MAPNTWSGVMMRSQTDLKRYLNTFYKDEIFPGAAELKGVRSTRLADLPDVQYLLYLSVRRTIKRPILQ